jgi:hypothetical protein
LPGAIVFTIFVLIFAIIFLCILAWGGHCEQQHYPTIQTGIGGDYDRRTPSQFGGILHIIRVKITNATGGILTGARLSIINLSPATAGFRDLPLARGHETTLLAGDEKYVDVASHTEGIESSKNVMSLQTSYPGGFSMPADFGILRGEHRFQLRLTRNEKVLADIYCRLYVDDHNVMRLDRLDKCGAQK